MSDVNPRTRRDRAEQTRRRIIRSAHAEFCAVGYHGATMTAIAKRAEVAVQTVYFVFHTKAELFTDTFDAAVLGEDATRPEETAWFVDATGGDDLRASVAAFTAGNGAIQIRVARLYDIARVARLTDPDIARIWVEREEWRRLGYGAFVQSLADRGGLRPDLDMATATDIALTLLGPGTYLTLVDQHGWSHERYLDWITDAMSALLLSSADEPRERPRRRSRKT
jgi:AcrR family transcriptional regulator